MNTTNYDNWKTSSPYNDTFDCEECENCQGEFEHLYQVGQIWVCEDCKDEVEQLQAEVEKEIKPILELKVQALKRKLNTESIMGFLPKEMLFKWLKKELTEHYHIQKDRVRIKELNVDECECVLEILHGLYQHNDTLKNIKKAG